MSTLQSTEINSLDEIEQSTELYLENDYPQRVRLGFLVDCYQVDLIKMIVTHDDINRYTGDSRSTKKMKLGAIMEVLNAVAMHSEGNTSWIEKCPNFELCCECDIIQGIFNILDKH